MNLHSLQALSRMAFSSSDGWPELAKEGSVQAKVFMLLVVPLSILPPVMVYLAGRHYGDAFIAGFGAKNWGPIAILFFVGELLSVALMGWLIRQVATTWGGEDVSPRDAYLLASIAPIPLWFSSLGLLVPSLVFNAAVSILALCLSCGLVYHGVQSFCKIREDVRVAAVTYAVFGAGLIVWALLLLFVMI